MSEIEQRINLTLSNLVHKRDLLQKHLSQYKLLRTKLDAFESQTEEDSPEIKVSINQRARVTAHVLNPRRILAFLGSDYFVERDPLQAVEIVERKVKYLTESISEFNAKIKEAKTTLKSLHQIINLKGNSTKLSDRHTTTAYSVDDDMFPLMDIREELDEDGNVISSSVKQSHNELFDAMKNDDIISNLGYTNLNDVDEKPKVSSIEETHNLSNQFGQKIEEIQDVDQVTIQNTIRNTKLSGSDLKQNVRSEVKQAIYDIVERDSELDSEKYLSVKPKDEQVTYDILNGELDVISPGIEAEKEENVISRFKLSRSAITTPMNGMSVNSHNKEGFLNATEETTYLDEDHNGEDSNIIKINDVFFTLFKEMKIIDYNSNIPSEIHDMISKLVNEESTGTNGNFNSDESKASDSTVDIEDILQLQIISDEFDVEYLQEDENYEDEGVYDRAYYYEDDEDEDEIEESETEAEYNEDVLESGREDVHEGEEGDTRNGDNNQPLKPKSSLKSSINEGFKSVSFASTVQIKNIERVDFAEKEEIILPPQPQKISKFKQSSLTNSNYDVQKMSTFNTNLNRPYKNSVLEATNEENRKNALDITINDIIVERKDATEVSTKLETSLDNLQNKPSKFKKVKDVLDSSKKHRELVENDSKPLKISKFKQTQLHSNKQIATVSIAIPTNENRETKGDISERIHDVSYNNLEKVNKNKVDIMQSDQGVLHPAKFSEILEFRKYIEGDQDDDDDGVIEQLFSMGEYDFQVYGNPDEADEFTDDDEENNQYENEDDNTPMMFDSIVENEDIDDPMYSVDGNQLEREYQVLRQKMKALYVSEVIHGSSSSSTEPIVIAHTKENGRELEPIDEHGNPIKVSRFKRALNKK